MTSFVDNTTDLRAVTKFVLDIVPDGSVVWWNSGVSRIPVTTSVGKLATNQTREFCQTLMKHED